MWRVKKCGSKDLGCGTHPLHLKIAIIGLLLMTIGNAYAWDDESAPFDNETLNYGFDPMLNESTANNPYLFGMNNELMHKPFQQPYYSSLDPITRCTSYMLYKQVWDGSSYVQIENCNISIDACIDLYYNPTTEMYELQPDYIDVMTNGFLVSKYFQELINSDSEYCSQWNSTDDSDFPDVFHTVIEVDAGTGETQTAEMYTSLDEEDVETMKVGDIDYGFALDGRGSGGSSGSIYDGIDMYGSSGGDSTGMGAGFNTIFWCIIPLIFILAVMKLSSRCLK